MVVVAVSNQKGGTAKTTTAVALAHRLAQLGRKVILVDLDSQGSCAASFGMAPTPGLFSWVITGADLASVLVEVRTGLQLVPGDVKTAEAERILAGSDYPSEVLADRLGGGIGADFVILDCAPSRGLLHMAAHHAADVAIVPVAVDHLGVVGCLQEMDSLDAVRKRGHNVEVLAVVPTFFDSVTIESRENLARLQAAFDGLVTEPIPRATKVREATAYGHTVWEHLSAAHPVCVAYRKLAERVLIYGRAN